MVSPADKVAKRAIVNALSFHEAALRCAYSEGTTEPLPMIVNFAFASELYLKGASLLSGIDARGHNLAELARALPEKVLAEMIAIYGQGQSENMPSFMDSLAEIATAFVDWRYVYEVGSGAIRHGALHNITQALCVWCVGALPEMSLMEPRVLRLFSPEFRLDCASWPPPA